MIDPTSRRAFLRACAAVGLGRLGQMNALAQGEDYRALVCIFLFGGNDSDNMVVPVSAQYGQYAAVRGDLAIPRAELLAMPGAGEEAGLHPAMAALHPLYGEGRLAAVTNVGLLVRPVTRQGIEAGSDPLPRNLFSHSDQQEQWQTAPPNDLPGTGWAGRTADRLAHLNAGGDFPTGVSLAGNSVLLVGRETQPAAISAGSGVLAGSDNSESGQARAAAVQQLLDFPSGFVMVQEAKQVLSDAIEVGRRIQAAIGEETPLATQFPQSSLGNQLEQVARLIKVRAQLGMRRQVFFCSTGGFDTHSDQLGQHAGLLGGLGSALAAFYRATEELGVADRVTAFTESEFGRTFAPNNRLGTDHAWGTHQLVLGGAVRGGSLYGRFAELRPGGPDDVDDRGRWIPSTALDQYAATLAKWFGLDEAGVDAVLPNLRNFSTRNLGFLG
jgi:uncharacterized protein (DUF1501 family)